MLVNLGLQVFRTPAGHRLVRTHVVQHAQDGTELPPWVARCVLSRAGDLMCMVREETNEVRAAVRFFRCCVVVLCLFDGL